ncbi:MAG: DUF1730 domain-containing protein [Chloroflexi bacterium]|nr:DUF1730 domain-containing protein [Chloroflexota bacterium]
MNQVGNSRKATTLTKQIKQKARELGFDLVGIAAVGPAPDLDRYRQWLAAGYAGEMDYLARHTELKADPRQLLAEARSIILVGLNYGQAIVPELRQDPARGQIASYALGSDYHRLMRKSLIVLDQWLAAKTGRASRGRVFVDSAPLLERSWGKQAGLGFIGKNTCLIHPQLGSYFFLGGLLTPERLIYDTPPTLEPTPTAGMGPWWHFREGNSATCGRCTRCLQKCPTGALVEPGLLDARQCISYLTIEFRGEIPQALRSRMGNWVFGCDVCQDVCPWNRRAPTTSHPRLQPHPDRIAPPLLELLALSESDFEQRFRGSAVRRARWQGFMRNVCVAAGNWGDEAALEGLSHHLYHSPPLVANHAAWALARLRGGKGRAVLETALAHSLSPSLRAYVQRTLSGQSR